MEKPNISIIVAMGEDRAIGKHEKLLWHITDDLKRFKALTLGHPVIMGRKTFESIVKYVGKPLPDRKNIVITRNANYKHEGGNVYTSSSVEEALKKARELDKKEIFIIGGAQIYEQTLPFADMLYLTLIEDKKEADVYFPPYEDIFTEKAFEEKRETKDGLKYTWVNLERA